MQGSLKARGNPGAAAESRASRRDASYRGAGAVGAELGQNPGSLGREQGAGGLGASGRGAGSSGTGRKLTAPGGIVVEGRRGAGA